MFSGERLAELRKDRQLRQRDLAKELGLTENNISNYERGAYAPDDGIKIMFCKYFDVSLDYLMELTDMQVSYDRKDAVDLPKGFPEEAIPDLKDYMKYLMTKYQEK